MIELHAAHTRVPPLALAPLTAHLGAGVHALLGGKHDGAALVLGLITGALACRAGRVAVLGFSAGDARVRAAVAYVPFDVALPEPLRVHEALALASSIRGEPPRDPRARLAALGVGPLADRAVRTLSFEEKRAVALAEAITSDARVILVEEPLAAIDPRVLATCADALRARARNGACVVVTTASAHDARALADDVLAFDRGALVRRGPASDPVVLAGPRGAVVHVVVSGGSGAPGVDTAAAAKLVAAALARDPAVHALSVEHGAVVARGPDAVAIASAVARAARESGVSIDALRPELLAPGELRAAIAGDVAGAYRGAFERSRRTYAPLHVGPSQPPPSLPPGGGGPVA